ncbi:MAG: exonuclease domain-containing protein, partial [Bacteroidota bacterium]
FSSLVYPERSIPYNITKITGITDEMVAEAPRFYEIAKQIVELTQGAIFVAHNVRFDYNFIREEFRQLGYTYKRKQLDTVRLSRKVFPGLPSYALGKLIKHFGISVDRRHRALDDALATTDLLQRILNTDQEDQAKNLINHGVQASKLPQNISLDTLHNLPEGPGVYYFHSESGEVIYVGKSINIKKRVMDHFASRTRKSIKIQRMIHEITYEETGSELIALLLEQHEIKRLRPVFNTMLKTRTYKYCIHQFVNEDGFDCMEVSEIKPNQNIVREFTGRGEARGALAYVCREFGLCRCLNQLNKTGKSCFDYQLRNCSGAYLDMEAAESYNQRSKEAVEALQRFPAFPDDMLIIDKGRSPNEKAIVCIEAGLFRGFGFCPDEQTDSTENMMSSVKNYAHNKDVVFIIKDFLKKNPSLQILKTEDRQVLSAAAYLSGFEG